MMTGASRDSLAASLEAVGPALDEGGVALARELFGALDVVDEHGALRRALTDQEVTARLRDQGADATANSPEAFAAFITEDRARWGGVIRGAGVTAG